MEVDVSLVSLDGLHMCRACVDGIGQECHTPECICWLHAVDIPFTMVQVAADTTPEEPAR